MFGPDRIKRKIIADLILNNKLEIEALEEDGQTLPDWCVPMATIDSALCSESVVEPIDPCLGVLTDILLQSKDEAKLLELALHEFTFYAFALRDGNGDSITALLSNVDQVLGGHVDAKCCLSCDGLNERMPGGDSFPKFCKLPACEGKQASQQNFYN